MKVAGIGATSQRPWLWMPSCKPGRHEGGVGWAGLGWEQDPDSPFRWEEGLPNRVGLSLFLRGSCPDSLCPGSGPLLAPGAGRRMSMLPEVARQRRAGPGQCSLLLGRCGSARVRASP